MLVLSRRLNEKLVLPDQRTSIQVIAIKSGVVRLGITAPEEIRILREEVPDRVANWGPARHEVSKSISLTQLNQMLNKRLEIARLGLSEAQQLLSDQPHEASFILDKVDEDLHMLQHRLRREFEKFDPPEQMESEDHDGHLCQTMVCLPR
jgi:carbon storage regulator